MTKTGGVLSFPQELLKELTPVCFIKGPESVCTEEQMTEILKIINTRTLWKSWKFSLDKS